MNLEAHQAAYAQFVNSHKMIALDCNAQYLKYHKNVHAQLINQVGEIDFNLYLMMCTLFNYWYLNFRLIDNANPNCQMFNDAFKMNLSEEDFNRTYNAFKLL